MRVPPNYVEISLRRDDSGEGKTCQFKSIIKHVRHIVSKGMDKEIPGDLRALVDPDVCDGKAIYCCPSCFSNCGVFNQIERLLDDYDFKYSGMENLNFLVRRGKEIEYLTCKGNDELFLVLVNQNPVTSVHNQILLVPLEFNRAHSRRRVDAFRLFDYNGVLRDLDRMPAESLSSLDFKLPIPLLEDVNKDVGWWTLKNMGVLVITYYAVGTFLVLVYYGLIAKEHN